MKLSTRGRYAVMAMADLARHTGEGKSGQPVPLGEIAQRQEISLHYLEQLFGKLRRGGLVVAVRPSCEDVEGDAFCVDDQDRAISDISAYVGAVAGTGATAEKPTDGKSIFTNSCGACHTLADAGTTGAVGPNLDDSKPSKELAVDRVTNGRGAMPAFSDSLDADQIEAVAEYVAGAAGK